MGSWCLRYGHKEKYLGHAGSEDDLPFTNQDAATIRHEYRLAFICSRKRNMKKIVAAAVIAVSCMSSAALAGERVGDAALGGVSGAIVFGPVGALAGVAVGYTAGPAIARSWGLKRHPRRTVARRR